jgi:hypothetical protein
MPYYIDSKAPFEQVRLKANRVPKANRPANRYAFNRMSTETILELEVAKARKRIFTEPAGKVKRLVVDGKATCPEGEALLAKLNNK